MERPVEKRRNKCSMAKWNECAWVPRELTLNELSWVMTVDLDVPAYEPVAWADAETVAWADAPTPATKVCRKLSNRVSANNSRMKKKLHVAELEARVLAVEQENAALRAELRAAELENSRLAAAAAGELMLCLD